jgi:hypothetical protein
VFPRKGAFTVTIDHFDIPGALREILKLMAAQKLNVLSALLRRGGAEPNMATLVAVCEPLDENPRPNHDAMEFVLGQIPPKYGVQLKRISEGRAARDTLIPTQYSDIIAQPSAILAATIEEFRRDVPSGRFRIFLSQRWDDDGISDKYSRTIGQILQDLDCVLLEAKPEQRKEQFLTSFQHVAAKMWMAKGGIVLLAKHKTHIRGAEISLNVAHELGFLQGQGKPVLILMDKTLPKGSVSFEKFANLRGAEVTHFDPTDSFKLRTDIQKWVERNL